MHRKAPYLGLLFSIFLFVILSILNNLAVARQRQPFRNGIPPKHYLRFAAKVSIGFAAYAGHRFRFYDARFHAVRKLTILGNYIILTTFML